MLFKLSALAVLATMPCAGLAAGTVALTTLDGSLRIEGELLSFDGAYFRIETEHGALTLDGGDVTCDGEDCPDPDALIARAKVGGPEDMIHRLMPPLLESFADREGLGYRRIFTSDETVTWELFRPENEEVLARIEGRVGTEEEALTQLVSRDAHLSLGRKESDVDVDQDVIALDALVPVVSVDNPRAVITLEQFRGLLTGAIGNWAALDGDDFPVALHLPEGPDVRRSLSRVFGGLRLGEGVRYDDNKALARAVADDPAALGLVPLSRIGNTVPLVISGSCGLASPATRASVKAEDYPLTQPLFLHRNGARQPRLIRDFIAYARSHEAQPVIQAAGFVDQGIGRIAFDRQGDRLANAVISAGSDQDRMQEVQRMVATLMEGQRLTLTFRFRDGSSELDAQSTSNIRRLSDAIGRGDFAGKELMFVGFTDGQGASDGNVRLSIRRAKSVRRAVSAFAGDSDVPLVADGFGEILPMACDDTAWGRQVNRRVEVWVRGQALR
ncbi:MAG: cell envelope biogenesis protein OmpA [Rhodobacteraceae bacterium]|nr:MAG: cell envelope biogenesis protein OmpA [Paracoccaceae bacterium]